HQPEPGHHRVRGTRRRDHPHPEDAGPALAPRRPGGGRCPLRAQPGAAGSGGGRSGALMAAGVVGGILLAGITLYAVLGGADFGGGRWDLLAGGERRGRAPRALIDESITPVWEANHVWLVFALVIFWTAFPHAFAAVMTTLALPLWLAAAGIVLRGAGFAFRKEITRLSLQRAAGATFAFSSLMTPFFMGTVIGAIATGAVPPRRQPRQPGRLDQPHRPAGRVPVRRRLRLPGRRLPGRRGRRPRRPAPAGLLHLPRPGRRHRRRGPVAGDPGRAEHLQPRPVRPAHRPGIAAGDHRRSLRPGGRGPARRAPARPRLAHPDPGHRRARRRRRRLGLGRSPVPGTAARHPAHPGQRGRPADHPGRAHRRIHRRRAARRAILRPPVFAAEPTPAARGRTRHAASRCPDRPHRPATGPAPAAIPRPAPQPRHPERRARNDPDRRGHPPAKTPLTGIPNEAVVRLGAGFGYYTPLIRLSCPAHSRSRSQNFWILPVEVFCSGPNSMVSGHL